MKNKYNQNKESGITTYPILQDDRLIFLRCITYRIILLTPAIDIETI
jgi:hypothetical protein